MFRVLVFLAFGFCLTGESDAGRWFARCRPCASPCVVPISIATPIAKPCPKPETPCKAKPKCDKPKCEKSTPKATCPADAPAKCAVPVAVVQCIEICNSHRARVGLAPLVFNARLHRLCHEHSDRQARSRSMHHSRLGMRENVAMGPRTAHGVMGLWMNSSGHRANILTRRCTQIGVCEVNGYWTMILQ